MKSHYRAIVIGGGVVGCSILYHLTKKGWSDILLIERDELTSGSTWHAAGGFHTLNGDPNVAKLQEYTINLYKEIEEVSGQSTGCHVTGGVMLVSNKDRFDWLKMAHARNKYLGVDTRMISVEEAAEHFPLMDKDDGGRRSRYQTIQTSVADAPAPDEIIVALGASVGGHPNHRIGDRYQDLKEMGRDVDNPAGV